eukprot:3285658-Rhodomonas_salina.4
MTCPPQTQLISRPACEKHHPWTICTTCRLSETLRPQPTTPLPDLTRTTATSTSTLPLSLPPSLSLPLSLPPHLSGLRALTCVPLAKVVPGREIPSPGAAKGCSLGPSPVSHEPLTVIWPRPQRSVSS